MKYRYQNKEKRLSLGIYPDVPLAGRKDHSTGVWIDGARDKRDAARRLLAAGIDPSAQRKASKAEADAKSANTLEVVAREWLSKNAGVWSTKYLAVLTSRFEHDVFPWLGARAVDAIEAAELLSCLRRIESRGALETAHRVREMCGQLFRYAIATQRAKHDPAHDLIGALAPVYVRHLASITEPSRLGELLRAIDGYRGHFVTRVALRVAPLVFTRPGELRMAQWSEFDLGRAEWTIPAIRMGKRKLPHTVPLSRQAVQLLNEIRPLTGKGAFVFPCVRGNARPMSNGTINGALRRLDITKEEMCGHGFRAMARTVLDEVLGFPAHLIEHQLSHVVRDPLGRAYNRTTHLPERQKMMQRWADYLDELRGDAVQRAAA